jgi:hypothetical protein
VILDVEMSLQVIENSKKLKYSFNSIMLIFQCYSSDKGSRTQHLEYKLIGNIIQYNFIYFDDFMC